MSSCIAHPPSRPSTRLTFEVPHEDSAEFYRLPSPVIDRVLWLLQCMKFIAGSRFETKACRQIASEADLSFNTVYQTWQRFEKSGDWRVLIDKRKTSEFWIRDDAKRISLPDGLIKVWKTLCEENQRAFKPAHRSLIMRLQRWRGGDQNEAITGYSRPPANAPGSDYPHGWTLSNLLQYKPTDIETTAARQGRTAAMALLPGVHTTRVGTYPFREIQFDDMWHDFEVNAPRQKAACRLLEFNCADHHTCFIFRPGLKPRLRNQDDGKRKHLDGRDFHLYLVNWLLDYGVHPDGTAFNLENGTASISKAFEDKLLLIFDGRLTVIRSGMSGAAAFPGAYRERAKGNYKVKAIKEGAGKLIHNQLAGLIGQVGMHRENLPASHAGRSQENEALLFLQAAVPALAGKLRMGILDLAEAVYAVNEAYQILNDRHDHEIEGWEEMHYVIDQFRASAEIGGWISMNDLLPRLDASQQHLVRLQMELDPHLRRRHCLSPAEVLLPHIGRLIKPPHDAVPFLLGDEYMKIHAVSGGMISFTRPEFPGKLRYPAVYQDADGFRRRVENGSEVVTHFNPWKPEWLYLSDAANRRFLGRAALDTAPTRGDTDAIHRKFGHVLAEFKEATNELTDRHGHKRIGMMQTNTQAIRAAAGPTVREATLAGGGFDAAAMLGDADDGYVPADAACAFDPSDLL